MKLRKRICSALLCTVILLGTAVAPAAAAEVSSITGPTIVVTKVTGGETLEVSIQTSCAAKMVQTVLHYNSALLTPIQWDTAHTEVVVPASAKWGNSIAVPTYAYGGTSGKPALAYKSNVAGITTGYLYLAAEGMASVLPANTIVVTARFKYVDKAQIEAAAGSIQLADATIAGTAPAGWPAALVDETNMRYVVADELPTDYGKLTVAPPVPADGASQLPAGGTVTGGGFPITFFDWDGSVIDAIAAPENATEAVATFETGDEVKGRLTSKQSYAFDKWLVVEQVATGLTTKHGTFTSNDTPLEAANPDIANFSKLTGPMLVQAAYRAKSRANGDESDFVNNGANSSDFKYYTISEPTYSRYGAADATSGSYSMNFTVERGQDAFGVTRLREPAVMVIMTPVGTNVQNILSLVRLENTDFATYEIVPTKQIAKVSYKVIDIYGISNWPGSADKSDPNVFQDKNTFVQEGSRGFLAGQALAKKGGTDWDATVNAQAFADSFVNTTDTQRKTTAFWTAARCTAAKGALLTATTGDTQIPNAKVGTVLSAIN